MECGDDVDWTQARCIGLGDLFFSDDPKEQEVAKAMCRGCPLGVPCSERFVDALADGYEGGVWNGMTGPELEEALRDAQRRRARAAGHPSAGPRDAVMPGVCEGAVDGNGSGRELPGEADPRPGA